MCLTCGCGQPNKEMGDANITLDDLKRAADENNTSVDAIVSRLEGARDLTSDQAAGMAPPQGGSSPR